MPGRSSATVIGRGALPESFSAGLRILAVRALGNEEDAADAVQETLARALAAVRADRIPSGVPLPAFVHGIARHVFADVLRKRFREGQTRDYENLPANAPSPLDGLVLKEECARLKRALDQLSERDRSLLRRCYMEGERLVDIARAQGQPAERVRKRKSRALARLRERLGTVPSGHVSARKPTDQV